MGHLTSSSSFSRGGLERVDDDNFKGSKNLSRPFMSSNIIALLMSTQIGARETKEIPPHQSRSSPEVLFSPILACSPFKRQARWLPRAFFAQTIFEIKKT